MEDIIETNSALKMIEGTLRRATLNYIPEREIANIQALCNILSGITRENDKAIKMIYDDQEIDLISRLMRNEGSGFEMQLGEALSIADSKNAKRIMQAFPELYTKYNNRICEYDDDIGLWTATRLKKSKITIENSMIEGRIKTIEYGARVETKSGYIEAFRNGNGDLVVAIRNTPRGGDAWLALHANETEAIIEMIQRNRYHGAGECDEEDSGDFGLHTDMILGENPDMLRQD